MEICNFGLDYYSIGQSSLLDAVAEVPYNITVKDGWLCLVKKNKSIALYKKEVGLVVL